MNVRSRRFALDLTSVIFGLLLGLATIGYVRSQTVSGSVNLTISPSTTKNGVTVTWQVDGYAVGKVSAAPFSFTWDSTNFVDGLHTITAITTNSDGSQTSSTIATLYTQNGVPAKTVYLDADNGVDLLNTCLDPSQACQTFAKANLFIYHGGDNILLKAGSNMSIDSATLATELTLLGPNSTLGKQNAFGNGQPITISTYSGNDNCNPLARITTDCATVTLTGNAMTPRTGIVNSVNVPNVFVKNLRLVGSQLNALCANCGYGLNFGAAGNFVNTNGPHIENNEVIDFNVGIYVAHTLGQLYTTSGVLWNVGILDNYVHGSAVTSTISNGIAGQGITNPLVQGNLVENTGGFPGNGSGIVFTNGGTGLIDQFNVTRNGGGHEYAPAAALSATGFIKSVNQPFDSTKRISLVRPFMPAAAIWAASILTVVSVAHCWNTTTVTTMSAQVFSCSASQQTRTLGGITPLGIIFRKTTASFRPTAPARLPATA